MCKILRIALVGLVIGATLGILPIASVKAALTDPPTSWSNFTWENYLHNGNPVYDEETSADSSNGGTAVQPNDVDIASGAAVGDVGPGTEPSVLFAYYDGGTPGDAAYADDFLAFRTRLGGDPQHTTGYNSRHWDVILDVDGDNWKEFVVDLAGDFSNSAPDRLYVFYNDNAANTYDPATDQVAEFYAANNIDTGAPQTYNHTRVVPATGGLNGAQVWLDVQIPMTALKDNLGVQQVFPSTMFRLFYSTSTSNTNPLQKDWMLTPFSFGDPLMPNVEATKTDSLFTDADSNGLFSPGDTILYTIVIANDGNLAADGVTFSDTPDANTSLLVGSVTTTQGSVIFGNTAGDTTVGVYVGTLANGGGSVTITFKVTINSPFPAGVTQVSNQGTVYGTNITDEPTDDPDTGADDDSTVTPVVAVALDPAIKSDSLLVDADGNGVASPGDTLLYEVTIWNEGSQDATGVIFSDTPDLNTALLVGSVSTTKGVVTIGNNPGDTSVEVNVGTLLGGGPATETVTISFQVTINDPLPPGVTYISNQGLLSSNEVPPEFTDDPDTAADDDPTTTPLGAPAPVTVPIFPNIYIGIAAALAPGILAYFLRRRLVHQE